MNTVILSAVEKPRLRQLEDNFARSLDFAFAPLGMTIV